MKQRHGMHICVTIRLQHSRVSSSGPCHSLHFCRMTHYLSWLCNELVAALALKVKLKKNISAVYAQAQHSLNELRAGEALVNASQIRPVESA